MAKESDLAGNLMLAARLCRTQRATLLSELGLHAGQDILLKNLAANDGQSMGMLAKNLGVRPPTVTKMVSRMAAQGFLSRADSLQDSRQSHVFLTEHGRQLLDEIDFRWRESARLAFSRLSEKDEKRLRKILRKILDGFETKADSAKSKKSAVG